MKNGKEDFLVTIDYKKEVSEGTKKKLEKIQENYLIRAFNYGDAEFTVKVLVSERVPDAHVANIGHIKLADTYIAPQTTTVRGTETDFFFAYVNRGSVGTKVIKETHLLNAATPELAIDRVKKRMLQSVFPVFKIKGVKQAEILGIYDADVNEWIVDFQDRQTALLDAGFVKVKPAANQTQLFDKDGNPKKYDTDEKTKEDADNPFTDEVNTGAVSKVETFDEFIARTNKPQQTNGPKVRKLVRTKEDRSPEAKETANTSLPGEEEQFGSANPAFCNI